MFKKLLSITVLGIAMATPLLAGGCASGEPSYGLTGNDRQLTAQEKQRYSDSKGHLHTEWIGKPGR